VAMDEKRGFSADELLGGLPRRLARAYERAINASNEPVRHDRLLDLAKATVAYIGTIVQAQYVQRRDQGERNDPVEKALTELHDKGNPSFGDSVSLTLAYWRSLEKTALLQGLPIGLRRDRAAVKEFVGSWETIKEIWGLHREPRAHKHLNYGDLVPRFRQSSKEGKGLTSVDRFFSALVNCRNAKAHPEAFKVAGERMQLELGESYFQCVNPLLRAALEAFLTEFVAALGEHTEHRVTKIEGRPDGSQSAQLRRHKGLRRLPLEIEDAPAALHQDSRWLLDGENRPVLQLVDELPEPAVVLTPPPDDEDDSAIQTPAAPARPRPGVDRVPFNVPFLSKRDTFVGRDDLLLTVHDLLEAGRRTVVGQAANIHGLGGIGKTQLAVEYAHRYRGEYADGVVWFTANEPLPPQLADFAVRELGYPDEDKQENLAGLARQWLDTHEAFLLVLDNVDLDQDLDRLLPDRSQPRILVTSRHELPPPYEPVQLDELSPEDARTLLLQTAALDSDPASAQDSVVDQLCEELCYFPLALELAGSYLKVHRSVTSVARYLDMFRRKGLDAHGLDAATPTPGTRHVASVKATLALDRSALEDTPEILRLLEVMALWPVRSAALELLAQMAGIEDEDDARDLIGRAVNMSLLRRAEDGRVQVHPFLQEVVRGEVPDANLEALRSSMVAGALAWLNHRQDIEHIQAVAGDFEGIDELARLCRDNGIDEPWPPLLRELGRHLSHQGQAREATTRYLEPATQAVMDQGIDELGLTEFQIPLADALRESARYQEARDVIEAALATRDAHRDANQLAVADVLQVATHVVTEMGDYATALEYCLKGLAIRQNALGDLHRTTARSMVDLGMLLEELGRYEDALEQKKKALSICQKVLGARHPNNAAAYSNLGATLGSLGRYQEALEQAQFSLDLRRDAFGDKHPQTAVSYNNVGGSLFDLGRFEESLEAHGTQLEILRTVLGERHPRTAQAYGNLGSAVFGLGRQKEALELHQKAFEITLEALGPMHPDMAYRHHHVAVTLRGLGRIRESREHMSHAVRIASTARGPEHPVTQDWRRHLDVVTQELNESRPGFRQLSTKAKRKKKKKRKKKRR
jgi:tetratricopeptide (TPR) repeat protein